MQKMVYFRRVHRSYVLVAFLIGIFVGILLAMGLRWNFFASGWWMVFVGILLVVAFLKPTYAFLILGFVGGMILGFFRTAIYLGGENTSETDLWWWVEDLQSWFAGRIKSFLLSPEAELGISYLLGDKSELTSELLTAIRAVGLAHIVVASGAHLSILVEVVQKIFGKVSRFFGAVVSLVFILIFMAMVGWTPSILRAGIMSGLTILFGYYGRKFAAWRIILITMVLTLLIDPSFLTDVGWQLSFASYAGIMFLAPKMMQIFYGNTKIGFLSKNIITTLAATLATLPLSIYYFGSFSLILIVANVLILPTLPYAMGLTFLTGVLGGIWGIGDIIAFLTTKLLDFHILVVNFLAEQEYFIVEMPKRNALIFLGYIPIALFLGFWLKKYLGKGRRGRFRLETGRQKKNLRNPKS